MRNFPKEYKKTNKVSTIVAVYFFFACFCKSWILSEIVRRFLDQDTNISSTLLAQGLMGGKYDSIQHWIIYTECVLWPCVILNCWHWPTIRNSTAHVPLQIRVQTGIQNWTMGTIMSPGLCMNCPLQNRGGGDRGVNLQITRSCTSGHHIKWASQPGQQSIPVIKLAPCRACWVCTGLTKHTSITQDAYTLRHNTRHHATRYCQILNGTESMNMNQVEWMKPKWMAAIIHSTQLDSCAQYQPSYQ